MVTEIYKQDVRKFIHLVDDRIWKKAIEKKYHMLGSIWETESGMLPAGVMIYDIIAHSEHVGTSFIHIKWVYVSVAAKRPEAVYDELFEEINKVAVRRKIKQISITIPKVKEYNFELLSSYIGNRGYILMEGSSGNVNAILKLP